MGPTSSRRAGLWALKPGGEAGPHPGPTKRFPVPRAGELGFVPAADSPVTQASDNCFIGPRSPDARRFGSISLQPF